jgi:hypothetical protein
MRSLPGTDAGTSVRDTQSRGASAAGRIDPAWQQSAFMYGIVLGQALRVAPFRANPFASFTARDLPRLLVFALHDASQRRPQRQRAQQCAALFERVWAPY